MIEPRKKRFFVETFGCQMNVNDSEKAAGLLLAEGFEPADTPADADFVFVNTCAVREKASEKLYHTVGRLRKLKKTRPGLRVGVGGCVAQLEGEAVLERAKGVDVLVGTRSLASLPRLLRQAERGEVAIDLDKRADAFEVPDGLVAHSSRVRALVTAIEGCNHVCSFCVVPRTRGAETCRHPDAIVREVEQLVARGYAEVMLLGQTVNAYSHSGVGFSDLLERVGSVPGLLRLRFTTSHPAHVDSRLARSFRELGALCPYLHLPVQSGSDRILSDMRRGYTRREYLEIIDGLRSAVPGLALSTDVIVGYPGETVRDFEETLSLVEAVGFDSLFVFLYSPRPGTTAFRQAETVPEDEKKARFQVLNERQQTRQATLHQERVGGVEEVLIDRLEGEGVSGRTPEFRIVHVDGGAELLGRLVRVRVTSAGANALRGRIEAGDSLTKDSTVPILGGPGGHR